MMSSAIAALFCLLGCAEATQVIARGNSSQTATAVQYVRFTGASTYTFLCGIWFQDSTGTLLDNQCEREDPTCNNRCTVGTGGYGNTATCPGATPQWSYSANKNFRFTNTGQGGGDGIALFASEWIRPGCFDSSAQGGVEGYGPVTVTIDFGTPLSFSEYYVAFQSDHWSGSNPARAPQTWILEASNDGATYTTIHEQTSKPSSWTGPGSRCDSGWLSVNLAGVAGPATTTTTPPPTTTTIPGPSAGAAGGAGAAAVGDPHLQNVHGERFDLMKEGNHVLISIPRWESADKALLRVQADARRLGGHCADMYFQEVNVTGSWAEAKQAGGYQYSVSQTDVETPEWVAFGKVELKVVHGHTNSGLNYLNVYVKHLAHAGVAVGGLLGDDDHSDVINPPEACHHKMALVVSTEGGRNAPSVYSVAEASLA